MRRVEAAFLLFAAMEFGTWVAVLLYAYEATGAASVGIVALVQLLPAGLFAPVAASFGDRFSRERVLRAAYLLQAVTLAATAIGMLSHANPILVYVFAAGAASMMTITRPAQGSLLPSLARTPEELTAANGMSGTIEGAGGMLGPLTAAAILVIASPGAVFVAGAVACAAAVVLVPGSRPEAAERETVIKDGEGASPDPSDHARAHDRGLAASLRALSGNAHSRLIVALLGLMAFTNGAMDILFVLLALELFLTGEAGAGILAAALGLGTVIGGAASFGLVGRPGLAPALAISAAAWGGAIIVIGTIASAWTAPLVVVLAGIGYASVDVAGRTILQRVTPDRQLARVLGGLEGVGLIGLSLGAVLVPVSAAIVGIQATLVITGAILPIAVALAWVGLRRIDREVTIPVRELALLRSVQAFAPLPPPEIECVARHTRWLTFEPGQVLIREGDVGDRYYVLESGRVRITSGGVERRIAQGPGYGFGEIALLRDIRRTATVTALDHCVVLALERQDFLASVTGHEAAHEWALRDATERLAADARAATQIVDEP